MHVQPFFFSVNKKAFHRHLFDIFRLRRTLKIGSICDVQQKRLFNLHSSAVPKGCPCETRLVLGYWPISNTKLHRHFSEILITGNQLWLHQKLLGSDHYLHICDHNALSHWWQEGIGGYVQLRPWDDQRLQVRKHDRLPWLSATLKLPLTHHLSI